MNLPPRTLVLRSLTIKDKPVLGLDTGFEADSLEGLRLVKASRGQGWYYQSGTLTSWVTRGVSQHDQKLVVWGDISVAPGETPAQWPRSGEEGLAFLRALVGAWTALEASGTPLGGFTSSAVVPYKTAEGWAFVFPPPELRGVLDSLQPLGDRLAWDHFRHPDTTGPAAWAFSSAALSWDMVTGHLPWAQEEEAHLRQEIRELKRSLTEEELPEGPDAETLRLWFDSLTGRLGTRAAARWSAWSAGNSEWTTGVAEPGQAQKRAIAEARRTRRRAGAAFWRRRGTVTTVVAGAALLVAAIVGSIVWGLLKPDPTDTWTPDQVVLGYYAAASDLDADLMRKLTRFDRGAQPQLGQDQDEASNLFVIRQVRTAYEHQSPVVAAQDWESSGRPALQPGQVLFGIAGLEVVGQGQQWTARYRKWVSDSEEGAAPTPIGKAVIDEVGLIKTSKGWKISVVKRQHQPLP